MRRIALLLVGLTVIGAAAWFFLGQGADADRDGKAPQVLVSRLNSDILSVEPGSERDENTDTVLMHVVEGLVGLTDTGEAAPLLAERIDVSPDGLRYLFTLRQGVRFHNGQPLTSAEVIWSLERYLSEDSDWRCKGELTDGGSAEIAALRAPDARTVEIVMAQPAPLFLKTLARVDCAGAGVLHPQSLGSDGAFVAPIGTGPFRFEGRQPNQSITLARFEGYAALPGAKNGNVGGKAPLVDKVRFMIIPDSSAARAALMRGDIDILDGVSPNEVGVLRKAQDISVQTSALMDVYALLLQTRDPVLADARMRRAIALSIDARKVADAVGAGTASVNSSVVPVPSPYHKGVHTAVQARDLEAARALLQQAGYGGQPIRLIANKKYPQMFDAAVLIQAMAKEAGVNFQIETYDWATQLDRYGEGDYQAMTFAYSARMDPSFNYGAVIGRKVEEPRKVWDDPASQALLRRSMTSADPVQRQAAFDQLHARMLELTPLVVLYNPAHVIATRKGVTGAKTWPSVQQRLWGVAKGS